MGTWAGSQENTLKKKPVCVVGYVHLQCQCWGCRRKGRGTLVGQSNLPYLGNSRLVRYAVSKTKRLTMHTHAHTYSCMHTCTHTHACMHMYGHAPIHILSHTLNTHTINVFLPYFFFWCLRAAHNFMPVTWQLYLVSLLPSPLFLLCVYILMHIYLHLVYSLFQGIYVNMQ